MLTDITTKARNVGGYAPGELDEMLAQGGAVRVTRRGVQPVAERLRAGPAREDPEGLGRAREDAPDGVRPTAAGFVIPVVRYGNVVLMPQPARGWGEDAEKMYHAKDLAPHHQYVAAYAWLRNGFKADAVVHVGTHGTLEWLDGKDAGLSEEDAPDALIADLPDHLHLQRRRRRRRTGRAPPRHGDARRSHGAAVQEGRPLSGARRAGRD